MGSWGTEELPGMTGDSEDVGRAWVFSPCNFAAELLEA